MPLIALGCAVLAVAVSVVAAVIVVARDDEPPGAASPAVLLDQQVAASDVIKLSREIEVVVEAGLPRGVRVKDPALAQALGLLDDDVITAVSGRVVRGESDIAEVTLRGGRTGVTTLYVELDRGTVHTLVRWRLDGDLLDARRDQIFAMQSGSTTALGGSAGGGGTAGSAAGGPLGGAGPSGSGGLALDPFVDEIVKLDDTHSRVSRATLDNLLSNAKQLSRGCRIVPAVKNGKPDGYKLYAIRPSSVFARLGFRNGDTVHSVNGAKLDDVDDLVSLMVDAKRKVPAFQFALTRSSQPMLIEVEITK
jgi:S1-C subfamily serine protease